MEKEGKSSSSTRKSRDEIAKIINSFSIDITKFDQTIEGVDSGIKEVLQAVENDISNRSGFESFYKDLFRTMGFEYRRLATQTMSLKDENAKLKNENTEKTGMISEKQKIIDGLLKINDDMNGSGLR